MKNNRSVERVLSVLLFVCQSDKAVGLTEISQSVGLDKATTLRFLQTLANADMVRHEVGTRRYVQGAGIYNFWPSEIRKICRPYLQEVLNRTRETVCLIVPRGRQRVCIDAIEPDRELRIVAPVGRELPIYAGTSGRVFMAYKPPEQLESILQESSAEIYSMKGITDRESYMQELARVRAVGYDYGLSIIAVDTAAIAAPVFDGLGNNAATVVLRGPATRLDSAKALEFAPLVVAAAQEISANLAHINK